MVRARAIDDGAAMRSMRGVATRGRATRGARAARGRDARSAMRDAWGFGAATRGVDGDDGGRWRAPGGGRGGR